MLQKRIKKLKIVVDKQNNRHYINFNVDESLHALYKKTVFTQAYWVVASL